MIINLIKLLKVTVLAIVVLLFAILSILLYLDFIPGDEIITIFPGIISLIVLVREIKPCQRQLQE